MKADPVKRGGHRYYPCPICNTDHPSVTTLLDVIQSPALMGWMAKNGTAKLNHLLKSVEIDSGKLKSAEEAWIKAEGTQFLKSGKELGAEAADYGTQAHAFLDAHLSGKTPTLEALPEPSRKAVEGFLEWEKQNSLEVLKTEQTFYHCDMNYSGTADCVAKVNGELTLLDWKTSSGIYPNYTIQVWSYALADEFQNGDRLYRQIGIGRFGKDGDWEVKLFKRSEFPSIDTARAVMTGCGEIFKFLRMWDVQFPYRKEKKA